MSKRRVVITGMGAITPIGLSAAESWKNAKAGVCGIGPITLYDTADMKVAGKAQIAAYHRLSLCCAKYTAAAQSVKAPPA